MRLSVVVALGAILLSHSSPGATRRYRQYLDPARAEETLSALALKPRLATSEWLGVIRERKDQTYRVRGGDTLWEIAGRELGSPFLWRKLWQVNAFLGNPHILETGTQLKWYEPSRTPAAEEWVIPVVKLLPQSTRVEDIDQDAFLTTDIKNRARVFFFVIDEGLVQGKIEGSYSEYKAFTEMDTVYLRLNEIGKAKPGDRFAIIKRTGSLLDKTNPDAAPLGTLVRFLGEVRVIEIGDKFAKAEFTAMYNPVSRGDELIASLPPVRWGEYTRPPEDLWARIIMGEEAEHRWFRQGETVVLNRGSEDGMKNGYVFRVFRGKDPVKRSAEHVDDDFKGEVQVVQTSKFASVGYILRNTELLTVGDNLVPLQSFPDPVSIPPREKRIQEIP